MSRKDKENKQTENKEVKKEESVAKQEANKPLSPQEQKESDMAKQIIDLEAKVNNLTKELSERDEIIKQFKDNQQAKEQALVEEYKKIALDLQDKANQFIAKKLEENDAKFKADLAYAKKYALEDKALDLIDIITKFEQAVNLKPANPEIANWLQGFKMYLTMFNNLLTELGIQQIKPELGSYFDPNTQEPFETVKDPSKKDNTVCEVIHTGYKLYDHILKPACVKVIKNN